MSFKELIILAKPQQPELELSESIINISEKIIENPVDILRDNNYKIKLITPTSFGVQIDFAKKYNTEEIKQLLINFNLKFKDKSVFIIN